MLIKEDHIEEAKHDLHVLTASDPGFAPAFYSLGLIQLKHEDMDGAIQYFEKTLSLGADDALVHYLLATALTRKGDNKRAKASYLKAIEKNPSMESAYHDLGMLYYLTGEFDKSVGSLRTALKLAPASTTTMLMLGMAYIKAGKPENAVEFVTSLRQANDETKAVKLENVLRESQAKRTYKEPDKQFLTPGGATTKTSSLSQSKGKMSVTGNAKMNMKAGKEKTR